ncbi:selina-4(15),7(11)-diene synthase [Kitasatospora sp. GP82]|uniref:selina-4(15),7(11)-diene synthase n=1 Tax=Kitasatospora sp. GP82 TaxID=3035089 RepID=UPI002476D407|nr:selina-4(15),7(11)-diene synthase [Kitasatospora sp. GP82]
MNQLCAVPPLFSPFRPAIHPRHEALDRRTAAWAAEFEIGSAELRSRLVTHKIGTFAARILPTGDEEVVAILADFVLWLFGVDDGYCEEGELGRRPGELLGVLSRLLRVAQNPDAPMLLGDPLAQGVRDLQRRMSRYGTDGQIRRWVDALREYFLAVTWEAEHRSREAVPDLNDYALMRLYNGATSVVLPLLEMGHAYELPPHERDRPAVRAVEEMAHFVIGWDNDLLSHHKESRKGGYYLNVIRVLEHTYRITSDQAISMAIAQRDRVVCHFVRHCDYMRTDGSPELRKYLDSLAAFIRAAQDWELDSPRYTTPNDPADLPTTFGDSPTDDSQEPLPIPAISWWWDLLPRNSAIAGAHEQSRVYALRGSALLRSA